MEVGRPHPDVPRPAVRGLSHDYNVPAKAYERVARTLVNQQIAHAIGDVALRDAPERYLGFGVGDDDGVLGRIDSLPSHMAKRSGDVALRRGVRRVKVPKAGERRERDIEKAARLRAVSKRLANERCRFGIDLRAPALCVVHGPDIASGQRVAEEPFVSRTERNNLVEIVFGCARFHEALGVECVEPSFAPLGFLGVRHVCRRRLERPHRGRGRHVHRGRAGCAVAFARVGIRAACVIVHRCSLQ